MPSALLILFLLVAVFVVVMLAKTVRIVPQARAGIVERFGKYKGTLPAGLNIVVPFIDKVRYLIDLRGVLDEATGKWGIRVNRVEIKGIDPPPSIKDAMEKQMRADRDKRALILSAEGQRQSAILTAEGGKQASILTAEGDRQSLILRAQAERESSILKAQGEGQAIQTVFQAIHDGAPDQSLLAYQYLQMMPKIAEGSANKVWVIPSEITKAMEGLGSSIHEIAGIPKDATHRTRVDMGSSEPQLPRGSDDPEMRATSEAVQQAIAEAEIAANPGKSARSSIDPTDPGAPAGQ